ncbi:DUF3311 domain-containing protein [Streptomyces albus subsp. chlorinus]|uniref:DUF3311 domain-containing protein n=1 Tax=Streptomyces albus TaxID=1888 RepID=UPI0015703230|nr:DUF3311 domain-containing protein [Streptomyces albus]NSC23800.1 DUF3311 domain-containing protein [Streptomyces albus subsp. chlorinus]
MSAPPPTGKGHPAVTPARIVAGLCLFAPFVGILWVDSYARIEPRLIGVPFFYWYQMLWVLVSAALTMVAYRIVRREQAGARRAPAEPEATGSGEAR